MVLIKLIVPMVTVATLVVLKHGKLKRWPHQGWCIYLHEICDGIQACDDNSDEVNCSSLQLCNASSEFQCSQGRDYSDGDHCIPLQHRCDAYKDCSDDSDELNCTYHCGGDQFSCRNSTSNGTVSFWPHRGVCLHQGRVCNGVADCTNGLDEEDCGPNCPNNDFRCTTGRSFFAASNSSCIPRTFRCDRIQQCQDGSDEHGCDVPCQSDQTHCADNGTLWYWHNSCLNRSQVCDNHIDCLDRSDELHCSRGVAGICPDDYFPCGYRNSTWGHLCLPGHLRCNGHKDCFSGADELGCGLQCPSKRFACNNGTEINTGGQCVLFKYRCDGIDHCSDGSDENKCDCGFNSCDYAQVFV